MKPSSIILSVLLCLAIALGGFIYLDDDTEKVYIYIFGIFIFLLMIVYIMQAEIDWKWLLKNPQEMAAPLERQIATMVPFYRSLDDVEKKRFRDRIQFWILGKEHLTQGLETFPEDMKNLMAAYGVMMTFGTEKYLLQPYKRVVIYPHPFPSPNYKILHSSEINHEDGCAIFNASPLMASFSKPREHYNLILHEYSGVFMKLNPEIKFPKFVGEKLSLLEGVRSMPLVNIKKLIGLPEIDIRQVAVEHFFMNPTRFKELLPEEYERMGEIFNIDLLNVARPVIDISKIGDNPLVGE